MHTIAALAFLTLAFQSLQGTAAHPLPSSGSQLPTRIGRPLTGAPANGGAVGELYVSLLPLHSPGNHKPLKLCVHRWHGRDLISDGINISELGLGSALSVVPSSTSTTATAAAAVSTPRCAFVDQN